MSNRKSRARALVVTSATLAMFTSPMLIPPLGAACAPQEAAKPVKTAPAHAAAAPVPWTILIYGAADNNADGPIRRLADAPRSRRRPGLELRPLVDRAKGYRPAEPPARSHRRPPHLHEKSAERLAGGEESPSEADAECETDRLIRRRCASSALGKAHPGETHRPDHLQPRERHHQRPDVESGRDMGIAEPTAATDEDAVD